jgi:hypothetical protein
MTRGRNILMLSEIVHEVAKELQSVAMTLFWMELRTHHVLATDNAIELGAVVCRRQRMAPIIALNVVRVDKIEPALCAEAIE